MKILEIIDTQIATLKELKLEPRVILLSYITHRRIFLDNELPKGQSLEDKYKLPIIEIKNLADNEILIAV